MGFKKTDVCELLDTKYPIVQAAMGPFVTTKLCAAVSNAGGLGCISHTGVYNILKELIERIMREAEEIITKKLPSFIA